MNQVRLSESGVDRGDARSVAGILLEKNGPGDGDPSGGRFRLTQLCVAVLWVWMFSREPAHGSV